MPACAVVLLPLYCWPNPAQASATAPFTRYLP